MSELRKDVLTRRWVIVSAERGRRPSDFLPGVGTNDGSSCAFCPGREHLTPPEVYVMWERSSPSGASRWKIRVVPNKFPALDPVPAAWRKRSPLYRSRAGSGAHEVVIESPRHDLSMADFELSSMADVIRTWRRRILALQTRARARYVLVFKNHGMRSGASLSHPHSQMIALPVIPRIVEQELRGARRYYRQTQRCVFCEMVREESAGVRRMVWEDRGFAALCPYASRFPFETWIIPKSHCARFEQEPAAVGRRLAIVLSSVLRALRGALGDPPYRLAIHSAPSDAASLDHYHWHLELAPALTRIGGFEVGTGNYINQVAPEDAAERLRAIIAREQGRRARPCKTARTD